MFYDEDKVYPFSYHDTIVQQIQTAPIKRRLKL